MAVNDIIAIKQNVGGSFDEIATSTVIDGLKVLKQNTSGGFDEAVTPLTGNILGLKLNANGNYDESIISLFDGILYNNGVEGVEWEMGIQSSDTGNWILDKSQNVLHVQVSGRTRGTEASWTTKDPIDFSKFNNLKIVFDIYNSSSYATIGIFIGQTKNQSIWMNYPSYPNYFIDWMYVRSSIPLRTNQVANIKDITGINYISINGLKTATSIASGYIKIKQMILELLPVVLFDADNTINLGFEEGSDSSLPYYIQISDSNLHLGTSDYWASAYIVSSTVHNVDLFTKLRVTWDAPGNVGILQVYLADNKTDGSYGRPYIEVSGAYISRQTNELDISALTGNKYVILNAFGDQNPSSNFNVYKVELIP